MRDVEIDARNRRKTTMNGVDKQFKAFDDRVNPRSLMRNYDSGRKLAPELTVKDLEEVYAKLGKVTASDRKLDCGACGYDSCYDMAVAIYNGRNIPENCIMCAKHSSGSTPAAHADNSKASEIAEKVSSFATELLADIENIYASLYSIDKSNQQTASMSGIVEDILSKVVGFCSSTDSIDAENLPLLVSTLEKLQTAVGTLNANVKESAAGSSTIREAMQAVADATTELNVMPHDMVSTLNDKY